MRYFKEIDGQKVMFSGVLIMGDRQVINPTHEQMTESGWRVYDDTPTEEEQLRMAIDEKIAEIDAYNSSSAVDGFTVGGMEMWIGFEERQRIRTSVECYRAMGKDIMEKWFDGRKFEYPLAVWEQMLNALGVYASEALNATERHKVAVRALTSVDEVKAYDYRVGYPPKCAF